MSNTCAAACCLQQVIQTRKSDANLQQRQDLLSRFMCLRDEKCVATRCQCSFAATDPQGCCVLPLVCQWQPTIRDVPSQPGHEPNDRRSRYHCASTELDDVLPALASSRASEGTCGMRHCCCSGGAHTVLGVCAVALGGE